VGSSAAGADARGLWWLTFQRLRRDRLALAAGALVLLIVLGCFLGGPLVSLLLGHGPAAIFPGGVTRGDQPVGFWSRVPNVHYPDMTVHGTTLLVLGADGTIGRDELLRVIYGGQVTIEVAAIATLTALGIGVPRGAAGGYIGGRVDAVIVWLVDFAMAFPVLLMAIALGDVFASRFQPYTLLGLFRPGVLSVAVFIGLFTWTYMARLTRVQVLELREREFVQAARMVGSRTSRILRVHILPHVAPVLIPPATFMFAGAMLLEASLSILGVGIDPNTPSWGGLLSSKVGWLTALSFGGGISLTDPLVIYPSVSILVTVIAVATLGEQLRKALDPTGS
jgi:peptide/nickel transport system permease protein